MIDSSGKLVSQGTCAVLIQGEIKGTAWLVTSGGYLLTAGHVLGQSEPVDKVEVRFAEDVPLVAHRIQWEYQQLAGTDFAILKLADPQSHIHPLPVSLARDVTGDCRICGFGITLKDRSDGKGRFIGNFDPQNFSGNRLFELESKQTGEPGYSGSAVWSELLQKVVAIQIEATKTKVGPGRDTILAMPLYRIAARWELLKQLGGRANPLFDTTTVRCNYFTGRGKEMEQLKKFVFTSDPQTIVVTAVRGMGGVGKTTLVTEFVYQLLDLFPGGILWADFSSNQGDPLPILACWASFCERADLKDLPSKDIRARAVKGAIQEYMNKAGKMLAVFDDVRNTKEDMWLEGAHLLRKAIPDEIALIVTTRQSAVAQSLHASHIVSLDALEPNEALTLVRKLAPDITSTVADELTRFTGNLPLAIEIAANKVKDDPSNWTMQSLRSPETRLGVLEVDNTPRKDDSIRFNICLSLQSLPSTTTDLFQILGIFTHGYIAQEWIIGLIMYNNSNIARKFPDPFSIVENLRGLIGRSLLQYAKTGYRLHTLLHDYARLLLRTSADSMYKDVALNHMHYFLNLASQADLSQPDADTAWENIKQAIDYAYEEKYWSEVIACVQNVAIVGKFLHSRGLWQKAIECLDKGIQACELLGEHSQKARLLCQLGIHQRESGYYDAAETTFQQAITLAEELKDGQLLADVYFNAGYLQLYQLRSDAATMLLKKAIDFAEQSGNNNALGEALRGLGRITLSQGNLDLAESYLQKSRSILTDVKNLQGLAYSLRSLGEVYAVRKAYEQSLSYLNEALHFASSIGDKQAIAYIHRGIGDTYKWQGDNSKALDAYKQSEDLYRDVGDRAALSGALCSLGEVYLDLAILDKAQTHFTESHDLAQSIQVARWQGRSLLGLARVQEQLENRPAAVELGEQALQILSKASHRDAILAQTWLDDLASKDGDENKNSQ